VTTIPEMGQLKRVEGPANPQAGRRGAFPTADSLRKVMHLAIRKAPERWSRLVKERTGHPQPLHHRVQRPRAAMINQAVCTKGWTVPGGPMKSPARRHRENCDLRPAVSGDTDQGDMSGYRLRAPAQTE
jgi:hypothetical protein